VSPLTSFKLSELANILEAELDGNPDIEIFGLSSLDLASEKDISFISRESFIPQLQSTNAAAIICSKALSDHYKGSKLISDDPYLLYAKCSSLFKSKPLQNPGISKLASVDSSASVADSAVISNFVSVSKNSIIEDDVILMPGVFIGNDTVVRKGTIIHSNASIYESIEIGEGCIIHSGVVIGSDGLGFAKESNQWVKIEHLGKVLIGNNVELGSNTTIDRGSGRRYSFG
jgi:UDP-3-O-[3-hydroxymyristoyl] glucosamine N-acyltransferase